MKNKIMNNLFL